MLLAIYLFQFKIKLFNGHQTGTNNNVSTRSDKNSSDQVNVSAATDVPPPRMKNKKCGNTIAVVVVIVIKASKQLANSIQCAAFECSERGKLYIFVDYVGCFLCIIFNALPLAQLA